MNIVVTRCCGARGRANKRVTLPVVTVLIALSAFAAPRMARAQTFRGAIVGTILDQSQAPVPGAKVTVRNEATGLTRTATTDDAGNYDIPELPLGSYTVTVEKQGFASVTQAGLRVDVAA